MTRREFTVGPEFNLAKVFETARKLAARAEKKGLTGGYTVSTETTIQMLPDRSDPFYVEGAALNPTKPTTVTTVVIEGEPVRLAGWSFVAVAEWLGDQPVVTGSPWYEGEQVDRSLLKQGYCDYCQTDRKRGKVIIVENEAGERKQVGTSCAKDFFGQEVTGAWYSTKDPFEEMESYRGSGGVPMESLLATLTQAACVIRQTGWVPGWKADFQQTTAQVVRLLKGWGSAQYVKEIRAQYGDPTEADVATAERALLWGQTMEGDSDYAANVRAVFASGDWIEPKFIGLTVSVPAMMLKAEGELAEQAKVAETPITEALYAEPKTRFTIKDAAVTSVINFSSDYGDGQIIVIVGEGYRFKWMTSSFPGLEQGDRIDFTATVKGRDDYNGQVSTQVLRVKATKQEVAA